MQEIKLGDLCTKIVDGTHQTPKYTEDGIPFYSVENVTNKDFSNHKYISIEEHKSISSRCKVEKGDILMTRIGSIGDTVLVDWDYECSIYVSLALIKINNDKISTNYLYQYMKSNQFIKEVYSRSLINASPQKINMVEIPKIPIKVPNNLSEQNKIAEILSTWDKAIELKEKLIEHKKEQKKGLMQKLLTGEVRLPGFDDEWKVYKIGEICEYQNGTALEKYFNNSEGLKVISIGNYSIDGSYRENNVFINTINEHTKKFILNKNDLTMVLNDKTSTGDILGKVILIDEENKYIFNQRTMRLTADNNKVFPPFLHQLINSNKIHNKIRALAKGGTQIYINTSDVLNIHLLLPSLKEQREYKIFCVNEKFHVKRKPLSW